MGGNANSKPLVPPEPEWEKEAAANADAGSSGQNESSDDLVFETWATCRHKPDMPLFRWKEEQQRKKNVSYRNDETLPDSKNWLELDCGDDSFFVSHDKTMIGIADGVGGWRDSGVDPSLFANAFMGNSKLYADSHPAEKDLLTVMGAGYNKVFTDKVVVAGSSTACGVSISKGKPVVTSGGGQDAAASSPGQSFLNMYNLGDSGAMVLRHGVGMLTKTEEVTHAFNFPAQLTIQPGLPAPPLWEKLGVNPRGRGGKRQLDRVEDGNVSSVPVQRGDVVVLGTDGLFDNRFKADLTEGLFPLTVKPKPTPSGMFGGYVTVATPTPDVNHQDAQKYLQEQLESAWKSSLSATEDTPWSDALTEETGRLEAGGKTDDITIVVGRVMYRSDLAPPPPPRTAESVEK